MDIVPYIKQEDGRLIVCRSIGTSGGILLVCEVIDGSFVPEFECKILSREPFKLSLQRIVGDAVIDRKLESGLISIKTVVVPTSTHGCN